MTLNQAYRNFGTAQTLFFELNVMAKCERRHANMSKQTTILADIDQTPSRGVPFLDLSPLIKQYRRATEVLALLGSLDIDVTLPLGLVYGLALWFVSRVIKSKTFS